MNKKLSILTKSIMGLLMLVGVALLILVAVAISVGNSSPDSLLNVETTVAWLLYYTYIVFGIGLAVVLFSIIRNSVVNPKGIVKSLAIFVGFVAVVIAAYYLAPGEALTNYNGEVPPTAFELKLTDTILYLTYFTAAAAIVSIVFSLILNVTKK